MNTDCSPNKACSNLKCIDPCPGTCGQDANCDVVNHIPTCSCLPGYEGDPFISCRPIKRIETPKQPCNPSPCGPNSICKINNEIAVCSCQTGFIGSPPGCKPECVVSAECQLTQACLNNKCKDPCPGTCGINAKCQVINHNPICSCTEGFTGDPFTRCYLKPGKINLFFTLKTYKHCYFLQKNQRHQLILVIRRRVAPILCAKFEEKVPRVRV